MNSPTGNKIAIIGGGISGLAAAQRILERQPDAQVTLFEHAPRLGGVIQSTPLDGYLVEHSADSFIVSPELPWAGELCEKLKVTLISTDPARRGAAILRDGRLHPVPEGLHLMSIRRMAPLLWSPLLSWSGKLRVLAERFVTPRKDQVEESLGQFTRRRYGKEVFEQIVQPLVSGIYTADPEKLSMEAALPQFVEQERQYGSLLKAALHKNRQNRDEATDRGARYSLFRSPHDGMQSLISALESHLRSHGVTIRLETRVEGVDRDGATWQVNLADHAAEAFDGVIIATPIHSLPHLVGTLCPNLGSVTEQIEHVGTAIICMGFHERQLRQPLTCFGSVIPYVEGRKILAVSHTNVKFPSRAPAEHVLLRAFVGGALQPELAELDDDDLFQLAYEEVADIMQISGEPNMRKIVRWPHTTPQYTLGHRERIAEIRKQIASLPHLEIANNSLAGVGVPQCVRGGWEAANALLSAQ